MVEVKATKRDFNARERELLNNGYRKYMEEHNRKYFRKYTKGNNLQVVLVQGWKSC